MRGIEMERHRTIAASPIRSAVEAWEVLGTLVADTLERSPAVPVGSVREELSVLDGLGPALIAGGHLESKGVVLCDVGLHVTVTVATADAALGVKENLNPVPGGASATDGWMLYLPLPGALDASVEAAAKRSVHLSVEPAPKSAPAANKGEASSAIDLDALRRESSKW
ncbi:MAG: hypothetical protein OXF79_03395 [Chloroflexi bacterium]|nr:hypothetical protein [Chloroflexota bacterium]